MSIDGISSNIQAYQPVQSSGGSSNAAASSFRSSIGAKSSATSAASGSLQSLSSGLQNVLLQMQSGGGKTSEAGNPGQAAPGIKLHHHHAHGQQANAASATSAG